MKLKNRPMRVHKHKGTERNWYAQVTIFAFKADTETETGAEI